MAADEQRLEEIARELAEVTRALRELTERLARDEALAFPMRPATEDEVTQPPAR